MLKRTLVATCLSFIYLNTYAATTLDLGHADISAIKPLLTVGAPKATKESIKELSRSESNQFTHIRIEQTYQGIPVFGSDAVFHIKNAGNSKAPIATLIKATPVANVSMNGEFYQGLNTDLLVAPQQLKGNESAAVTNAINAAQKLFNVSNAPSSKNSSMVVYVDKDQKAHYAFLVHLFYDKTFTAPVLILDAQTLQVLDGWNDTKYYQAQATGFGGNVKTGRLIYDGAVGHLGKLVIDRDAEKKICYLRNSEATVKDGRTWNREVVNFPCNIISLQYGNTFFDGSFDEANDGYSPSNDALYAGSVIKQMYLDWYDVPMLVTKKGQPMMLDMISHAPSFPDSNGKRNPKWENAAWYNNIIFLGDGETHFYPLTSLDVVAHEISHGFTEQHSNLQYGEIRKDKNGKDVIVGIPSGGLNESFSDMASQAADQYATGKNDWAIGATVVKKPGDVLRYMDYPKKDGVSIDNVNDYKDGMEVHFSSGIFNRMFYVLSTSPGWDVRKAFNLMLETNRNYWTSKVDFQQAACDVRSAAIAMRYDLTAVTNAFKDVGINTEQCAIKYRPSA